MQNNSLSLLCLTLKNHGQNFCSNVYLCVCGAFESETYSTVHCLFPYVPKLLAVAIYMKRVKEGLTASSCDVCCCQLLFAVFSAFGPEGAAFSSTHWNSLLFLSSELIWSDGWWWIKWLASALSVHFQCIIYASWVNNKSHSLFPSSSVVFLSHKHTFTHKCPNTVLCLFI